MSNWRTAFEGELAAVFAEARRIVAAFPEPMAARGLAYVGKFDPLVPGSKRNYICYLLPFWLQELAEADTATCRRLSLANVFVMLYYFVQDDLMDTAPSDWKEQLALGNLFHAALLDIFLGEFAADSPFWRHYREYVAEWAVAVATESAQPAPAEAGARTRGIEAGAAALAAKAAPVKLASTGMLLLAGKERLVAGVARIVDETLATLQMADDLDDWRDDLAEGSGNSLLAFLHEDAPDFLSGGAVTARRIEDALAAGGVLERFAAVAAARHERLRLQAAGIPHLLAFHESLAVRLRMAARRQVARKLPALRSGFASWLAESDSR